MTHALSVYHNTGIDIPLCTCADSINELMRRKKQCESCLKNTTIEKNYKIIMSPYSIIIILLLLTHSLLFHPILFCRITNNLIYFFSSHAKRSGNFDNKNHFNKNDHMKLVKLLAAKRRCCKLQSVSP